MVVPALPAFNYRDAHPYLEVLPVAEWRWGWQQGAAVGALFESSKGAFLIVLGEQRHDVEEILLRGSEVISPCRVTLPRPFEELIPGERSQWDWMAIFQRPTITFSTPIVDLGVAHDEEIRAFLAQASPTASTAPGDPEIISWHGVADDEGLLAVGAATRWSSGAAVLASIATHPRGRGRGYAKAVTASLTQMLFDLGESRVSLGLYAGNDAARGAYASVGYQLLGQFTSGSR